MNKTFNEQDLPNFLIPQLKFLRYKKWDFFSIFDEDLFICFAFVDLGFGQASFIEYFNYKTLEFVHDKKEIFWNKIDLNNSSFEFQ